jgi:hypothetical protein
MLASLASLAALAALAPCAAGAPAIEDNERDWNVWMGPEVIASRPIGAFGEATDRVAFGPAFVLMLRPGGHSLGFRFDAALHAHDGESAEVVVDDGLGGTVNSTVQSKSRLSEAALGVQWERRVSRNVIYAHAVFGICGIRTEVKTLSALAGFEPPGRPESNRGIMWGGGVGLRRRISRGKNAAWLLELSYRRREDAYYVASPPFDSPNSSPTYRVTHDALETVSARLGLVFTKK